MKFLANRKIMMTIFVALFAALTLQTAVAAGEEVKLPETPAGKTFAAFMKAINSGDVEKMKQFHRERDGDVANAEKDMEFYQRSGGFTVLEVTKSSDYALEATIEPKNNPARLNFSIEVDSKAPHAILGIRVTQAAD